MNIKTTTDIKEIKTTKMSEMKPGEIGKIINVTGSATLKKYIGNIVMRTASCTQFQVMNLTNFGPDHCWTSTLGTGDISLIDHFEVELLSIGTKITLEVI